MQHVIHACASSLRTLAAITAALVISACSPLMQGSIDTLRAALSGPPELVVTRDEVMARPYYQLRLDSPWGSALMSLGRVDGNREYWATSTGQVLLIEHGLVRRAVGFPQTLEATRFVDGGEDPFAFGLHRVADGATRIRELDWMPGYRHGVRLRSRFSRGALETHTILGESRALLRIDEYMQGEGGAADFAALNRYWVDPRDGFVFISEQQPLPGMNLRITQLRPYREAAR